MVAIKTKQDKRTYSRDEVKQHNKAGDIWIIIGSKVYDVSNWIHRHPGGEAYIWNFAGLDCTDAFKTFHKEERVSKILPGFLVGSLNPCEYEESSLSNDIDSLRKDLVKSGAFDPEYAFYFKQAAFIGSIFALSVSIIMLSTSHLMIVVAGLLMGLCFQQTAFIGHDVGHHAISKSASIDDRIGIVAGNVLTGVSIGWWQDSHNTHHLVTNSIEYDPDIQHLPVFAITRDFFKSIFSHYHKRVLPFDRVAKMFVSYQHYLYYPIMGLARVNLYIQSFVFLLFRSKASYEWRRNEIIALLIFWFWFSSLCSFLPTWLDVALFFWTSHIFAGILHVQITLSHFTLPAYHGLPLERHDKDSFIITQFESTMDIACHPFLDFFHGGLQFQMVHHIFPFATRNRLRSIQPKLKEICKRHGVTYHEESFWDANVILIKTLKETAEQAREFSSFFVDSLNARG